MQVTGKVVVVTGGANGIGQALCEIFHRHGAAKVVVADLDVARAEQVAAGVLVALSALLRVATVFILLQIRRPGPGLWWCALCGMAASLGMLIGARVLQGLAGGGLQPSSQAILLDSFPLEKQGAAQTLFGVAALLAPVVGPTVGGYITDEYSWWWIFYINLPVGALAFFLCWLMVQDPEYLREHRKELRKQPLNFRMHYELIRNTPTRTTISATFYMGKTTWKARSSITLPPFALRRSAAPCTTCLELS